MKKEKNFMEKRKYKKLIEFTLYLERRFIFEMKRQMALANEQPNCSSFYKGQAYCYDVLSREIKRILYTYIRDHCEHVEIKDERLHDNRDN